MSSRIVVEAYIGPEGERDDDFEAFEQIIVDGKLVEIPFTDTRGYVTTSGEQIVDRDIEALEDQLPNVPTFDYHQTKADNKPLYLRPKFDRKTKRTFLQETPFDPQLWRETLVGYGTFRKGGYRVTAINGVRDKTVSVWTYVTDEHDVVVKCVGKRGCGCQKRFTFSEWIVANKTVLGIETLDDLVAEYANLQRSFAELLFNHENVCVGRNRKRLAK